MTIPNPCTNSDQPATEYGVPFTSACPDAYYGRPNLPASGPFSSNDFNGKSNISFTPDGGPAAATGTGNASVTLSCNFPALWTYTLTGGGAGSSVDIGSGSTANSITFAVNNPTASDRTTTWNAHGEYGGVARDFTVTVTAVAI